MKKVTGQEPEMWAITSLALAVIILNTPVGAKAIGL